MRPPPIVVRTRRRFAAAPAAHCSILGALLAAAGCRQLVGIEDREVFEEDASATLFPACGLLQPTAACAACIEASCCAEAEACVSDAACHRTQKCVEPCASGDSACRLECSNRWDAESGRQLDLEECRLESCGDSCGRWDCLGKVRWQVPDPGPDRIAIEATVFGGATPIGGASVRVCSLADPLCQQELGSDRTTEDGEASVTFDTPGTPVAVFLEVSAEGWLDALLMLNTPPLSFNFNVGAIQMETREDVETIAKYLPTTYDSDLAVVKLSLSDCNLQPATGIDVEFSDDAVTNTDFDGNGWDVVAMNLSVPENLQTRVVARLQDPSFATSDQAEGAVVTGATLVVRAGAVTLAPFLTPTP